MSPSLRELPRSAPGPDRIALVTRAVALLLVAAGLALAAPLIWSAVSAATGLLTLGAIALTGTAVFQALPWLMQMLENHLLRLRKAEARRNPMEQLDRDCLRREQRLISFRQALVAIGGQIESMRQMLDERRRIDPAQVLQRQERALERMAEFHALNVQRLANALVALEDFRHTVARKRFEWEFALGATLIWESLNPTQAEELMQDLLSDEALRAVQNRFNTVFAELDIEMRSVEGPGRRLLDANQLDGLEAMRLPEAHDTRRRA